MNTLINIFTLANYIATGKRNIACTETILNATINFIANSITTYEYR